jgi:hypothetical protein
VLGTDKLTTFEAKAKDFILRFKQKKEGFSAFLSILILILKIRNLGFESKYLIQPSQFDLVELALT